MASERMLQECGAPSKAVSHQLVHASAPAPPPLSKGAAAVLADRQQRAPHKQAFLLPFGFVPCKATVRIWKQGRLAPTSYSGLGTHTQACPGVISGCYSDR